MNIPLLLLDSAFLLWTLAGIAWACGRIPENPLCQEDMPL